MAIENQTEKSILLRLLKDFSALHTVTSLAEALHLSRVGVWKALKRLEAQKFIRLRPAGSGKTSTFFVKLDWENPLVEKSLALYLAEESLKQKRWRADFAELEKAVKFLIIHGSILFSPKEAEDIDLLGVAQKKNFIKIQQITDKAQKTQNKKIHTINFTETELKQELLKPNKAFLNAVKKGAVLFGQENFVRFIKGVSK